jgi:ABC-type dipeptide/oligopeptide/nickel transport system permease subunit
MSRQVQVQAARLSLIALMLRSRTLILGLSMIAAVAVVALAADYIAPYKPMDIVGDPLTPPSRLHPLGTDDMGRDILSMVIYGSRVSLLVGIVAAALSTAIGTAVGLASSIVGGKLDAFVSRSIDFVIALPYLAVALSVLAFFKPSILIVILVIVALGWVTTAKVVRTNSLSILGSLYVEAAYAVGAGRLWIARKYVLPGVMPMVLSSMALNVRSAILFEAALSFLGMGDPSHVSWGTVLFFARRAGAFVLGAWWYIVPPGLMIMLTVLGFTLLAIGLDEALNPRLRSS